MAQSRSTLLPLLAIVAAIFATLAGCNPSPSPEHKSEAPAPAVNVEWTKFVDEFIEAYFRRQSVRSQSAAGATSSTARCRDWTPEGIQKEIARLEQCAAARRRLPGRDAVARGALPARLRDQPHRRRSVLAARGARSRSPIPSWYFDAGLDPSTYVTVPYAPADQRLRAFIKYAQQIPGAVAQIKKNLQMPLPQTFIDFGSKSFGGFVDFYRNDVPQAFAEVQDAELKKRAGGGHRAGCEGDAGLRQVAGSAEARQATDAYALGPERFATMLRMTENVTTPLDKLEEIGRADLERNLAALAEACKRYAPERDDRRSASRR